MTSKFLRLLPILLASNLAGGHAVAAEPKSQFERYLEGIPSPAKDFEGFVKQVHEAGLKYEKVPYAPLVEAMVPRGRSLQKDAARDLRAISFKSGPTYIGYAPGTDRGEVISWNVERGDFDFLQFEKLKKGRLQVKSSSRSFCLSCHQGALPIFPRAPWSEMTEDRAFEKYKVHDADLAKVVPSVREKKRFLNVTFFDKEVRRGKLRKQREIACRTMCGDDLECRTQLYLASLVFRDEYERRAELSRVLEVIEKGRTTLEPVKLDDIQTRVLKALSKHLASRWPESGFALPSTTIPDRSAVNPKNSGFLVTGRLRNGEQALTSDGFAHVPITRSPVRGQDSYDEIFAFHVSDFSDEPISEVALKTKESALVDPKVIRPDVGRIPKEEAARWALANAKDCFEENDETSRLLTEKPERLEKAVRTSKVMAAFCVTPVSTDLVGRSMREALDSNRFESTPVSCAEIQTVASGIADLSPAMLEKLPARGAFRKYCNECHGAGSEIPLKLDDITFLRTFPGAYQHTVRSSLESKIMPPKTARQPSEEERVMMLKAIDPSYRSRADRDKNRGSS